MIGKEKRSWAGRTKTTKMRKWKNALDNCRFGVAESREGDWLADGIDLSLLWYCS